jgi:hypothetical protein
MVPAKAGQSLRLFFCGFDRLRGESVAGPQAEQVKPGSQVEFFCRSRNSKSGSRMEFSHSPRKETWMELTAEIFRERGSQMVAGRLGKAVEKLAAILASRKVESPAIRDFAEGRGTAQLHRRTVAQELYEASFESGKEVIYLSIMSKNTLGKMPERIRRAETAHTKLNVLTWDPEVGAEVIKAFGNHLGEEATVVEQTRDACATWQKLAKEHPGTVQKAGVYRSSPTMQGLVVLEDWALVEMIPYRTVPSERPSIFLCASLDTELFPVFQSAFKKLLADARAL